MASSQSLSSSVRKGQAAMVCQLCEIDQKLQWKCLDCALLMCQRCKDKVHQKIASAQDHTIINIKEIRKDQNDSDPKPDLTKLKCTVHRGQNCCFYCETCEILVCQTCVTKTHNTHKFKEITEEYEIRLNKIKDEQKKVGKGIHILTLNEQKLKQIKTSEQSNYEKVKQDILDDEKALMDEIKKHTNTLLKDLDQKWEAVSNSIDSKTKQLKEEQRQIQEKLRKLNQLLQVDNATDVFSVSGPIFKSTNENIKLIKMTIKGVPSFIYGDKTKLCLVLGKLDEVNIQINSDLQVMAQFETELRVISSVLSSSDGGLWICDNHSGFVYKVEPNKDNLKVMAKIKTEVFRAALLPSGDLLLSVFGSSNLKLVPSGSTNIQDSVYTVSQLQPTGIHITKDNKIIVGAREIGPAFPVKGPRQVIVMDKEGHEEKIFQYDSQNKSLFSVPVDITSNSKGNFAVTDRASDNGRGRVVVLNQEGGVRNIYTGHPDVNNENNPFRPRGITTTPSDNFVVADQDNHNLHVLNSEGEIVTYYKMKEIGIPVPCSLCISTNGQLYIGCSTSEIKKERAKLFAVNNFLF